MTWILYIVQTENDKLQRSLHELSTGSPISWSSTPSQSKEIYWAFKSTIVIVIENATTSCRIQEWWLLSLVNLENPSHEL
jgi:hypothetical protein